MSPRCTDREYPPHWQLIVTLSHTTTSHLDGGCPSPTGRPPFSAKLKQPRSLPVRLTAGSRLYLVPVLAGAMGASRRMLTTPPGPVSRPRAAAPMRPQTVRTARQLGSQSVPGGPAGTPRTSTSAWRRTSRSLNASRSKIQRRSRCRRTANDQRGILRRDRACPTESA